MPSSRVVPPLDICEQRQPCRGFRLPLSPVNEQLAEEARILALQAAYYARRYGELPLPLLTALLEKTSLDAGELELLRDGTEALVGVLAIVVGDFDDAPDDCVQ